MCGGGARRQLVARVGGQPRVPQHVARAEPLARLPPQQRPDQALAARRQTLGHDKVAAGYFGEQRCVFRIVERIPRKIKKNDYLILCFKTSKFLFCISYMIVVQMRPNRSRK